MRDFLKNVRMREFEFHEWLDHKLNQVRLEEREACADICDRFAKDETGFVAEDCAAAIRERSANARARGNHG